MCRNIKPLFNFEPAASSQEIQDAAIQFVRKVSGMQKPNEKNQIPFDEAVKNISKEIEILFQKLETNSKPKNREEEAGKRRVRNERRFG